MYSSGRSRLATFLVIVGLIVFTLGYAIYEVGRTKMKDICYDGVTYIEYRRGWTNRIFPKIGLDGKPVPCKTE